MIASFPCTSPHPHFLMELDFLGHCSFKQDCPAPRITLAVALQIRGWHVGPNVKLSPLFWRWRSKVCETSASVLWEQFYWPLLQFLCTCSHSHILSVCQLPYSPLGLHVFLPGFLQQMLIGLASSQHVLFATCVATCVTMGEVLFSFFSRASFYFCLTWSLDLSHIKSLLHVFFLWELGVLSAEDMSSPANCAFIRLLQQCLCNHFAELCYSWFYLATWYA